MWGGIYLEVLPGFFGDFLHRRLELRQPQEVHIHILLLIMLLDPFGEFEAV